MTFGKTWSNIFPHNIQQFAGHCCNNCTKIQLTCNHYNYHFLHRSIVAIKYYDQAMLNTSARTVQTIKREILYQLKDCHEKRCQYTSTFRSMVQLLVDLFNLKYHGSAEVTLDKNTMPTFCVIVSKSTRHISVILSYFILFNSPDKEVAALSCSSCFSILAIWTLA
jgi:hypothetical protein